MIEIFVTSDTHYGHANILKFVDYDGKPVRPGFKDVDDMDEQMIQNFNNTVPPHSKVYHVGDICFKGVDHFHKIMHRLVPCQWRLILGNHDHYDIGVYAKYFRIEPCWRQFKDMPIPFIMSHVPLHPDSIREDRKGRDVFNVHGHIHGQLVLQHGSKVPDKRYINVCVEHTNYTPVHIEDLMKRMKL